MKIRRKFEYKNKNPEDRKREVVFIYLLETFIIGWSIFYYLFLLIKEKCVVIGVYNFLESLFIIIMGIVTACLFLFILGWIEKQII